MTDEWNTSYSFGPGLIPRSWRNGRSLYKLQLPKSGWLVDVTHGQSISAIQRALGHVLAAHRITDLTLSEIHGADRSLTTTIAGSIRPLVLDDGSLPVGILYQSKWGLSRHVMRSGYAPWMMGRSSVASPPRCLLPAASTGTVLTFKQQ